MLSVQVMAEEPRRHEVWVKLLREAPGLVVALVRGAAARGVSIPDGIDVAVVGSEVIRPRPDSLRADLVLRLGAAAGEVAPALVVEVQLGVDDDKKVKWPVYVVGVRAELACPVVLVVVAPRADVARWARMPIETGHPGFELRPVVLGPEAIPVITNVGAARRDVRLAVLSAMAHGRGEHGFEVGLAALRAVARLDEGRRGDYATYIFGALDDAVLRKVEETMEQGTHRELTWLERKFIEKGEAKGRVEGEARGEARGRVQAMRHDILRVLGVRGLDVPDAVREQIGACEDIEQLDAWLERAVTADGVDEILGDRGPAPGTDERR